MIRRRAYIQRHTRPKARRDKPRRRAADHVVDRDFEHWLHDQRCVAAEVLGPDGQLVHVCPAGYFGRIEADHVGSRGLGQKSGSPQMVPLCRAAHAERHGGGLRSFWWTAFDGPLARRAWLLTRAGELHERYVKETSV